MRRWIAGLALAGFMLYAGVYLFVYLTRAFRVSRPAPLEYVGLYHGDNFSRVLLVALLFIIGEIFVLYLVLAARRPRRLAVRPDLWRWLRAREDLTGEPADVLAERAIAQYRHRLEGGPEAPLPSGTTGRDGDRRA